MKQITPIQKFKEGATIQGFYLCVEKHMRHTRTGDLYLDIVLRDRTGQISAKVWDKVEEYQPKFTNVDPVAASAVVESFHYRIQRVVKRIHKANRYLNNTQGIPFTGARCGQSRWAMHQPRSISSFRDFTSSAFPEDS